MNQSYAFIGTSYLEACEESYTPNAWRTDPALSTDSTLTPRFEYKTNLIQAVSKRNPSNTIYNCSESGHGITTYYKRILTLLDRYDPDVFVFEIPNGQRMLAHTDNEYGENYDLHFPVQVYEAGQPQNLDEEYRRVSAAIIDDCQVLMSSHRLNKYWTTHTNMVFNLGDKQWQGYTRILSTLDDGMKSKFSDIVAQCEIINEFLVSKGKKVYWFSWFKDYRLEVNPDKITLLSPDNIQQWKFDKDGQVSPRVSRQQDLIKKYYKQFSYDNSHLHSKYMPEFAEYFDQIFK